MILDGSRKARHEFPKARPASRAFVVLGTDLLGRSPPFLYEFHKGFAAAAIATALLDIVDERDGLFRQLEEDLLKTCRGQSASVGGHMPRSGFSFDHGQRYAR